MSKGWKGVDEVLFVGDIYEMDGSYFEVFKGTFENEDGTQDMRVGLYWKKTTGEYKYPFRGAFALPCKRDEVEALIKILTSSLSES